MFDSKNYIPILKWKSAEKRAVGGLREDQKQHMTPLIQFVMPKPKAPKKGEKEKTDEEKFDQVIESFEQSIAEIHEEIRELWGRSPVFLDFTLLYTPSLKIKALEDVFEAGMGAELKLIPVLNLSDDKGIKNSIFGIAKKYQTGFCLRLNPADMMDVEKLNSAIEDLIVESKISREDIDLIVDAKEVGAADGRYQKCVEASQKITNLKSWRTFTLAAGAFPIDLSECKLDEENIIPRIDWLGWLENANKDGLIRSPAFGDYTIQHPIYNEASQRYNPTTSIKYAEEENWFILKGQKLRFDMFLTNAKVLAGDQRFYGEDFSYGDKCIVEKANYYDEYIKNPDKKGTGSIETWLMIGINHHLALVVHQIANLSGSK